MSAYEAYKKRKTEKEEKSSANSAYEAYKQKSEQSSLSTVEFSSVGNLKHWVNAADKFAVELEDFYNGNYEKWDSQFGSPYDGKLDSAIESGNAALDYLRKNQNDISNYDELRNGIQSYVDAFNTAKKQFSSTRDYYSQWKSEDDYGKWQVDWLNPEGETNAEKAAGRKDIYEKNEERISEIEEELPWYAKWWHTKNLPGIGLLLPKDKRTLLNEARGLEEENRQYDSMQSVMDDYFDYTTRADFEEGSSKRDYVNPTVEELEQKSIATDPSTWTRDPVTGKTYDKLGNEVDLQNTDEKGNIIHPWADKYQVTDPLGLFLSSTEEDKKNAYAREDGGDQWAAVVAEGLDRSWGELEEDEINTYYYILNGEGLDAAYEYLLKMQVELNRRETNKNAEKIDSASGWEKAAYNAVSVPYSVIGGIPALFEDATYLALSGKMNPYSSNHFLSNTSDAIRGSIAQDLNDLTGNASFLGNNAGDAYQALMSGADSLAALGMFGVGGAGKVLATRAATSTAEKLYNEGASPIQIAQLGTLAGVFEMFFEKYSLESLVSAGGVTNPLQLAWNFAKQGGVEMSEEMATEFSNIVSDVVIRGNSSDVFKNIQAYKDQGLSQGAATWEALKDAGVDVWKAGAGGFISGGGMGGVHSAVNYAAYNSQAKAKGKEILENDGYKALRALAQDVSGVQKEGKLSRMNAGTDVSGLLKKAEAKTSAKNVGKLSDAVETYRITKNISEITSELRKAGLKNQEAKQVAQLMSDTIDGNTLAEEDQQRLEDIISGNDAVLEVWSGLASQQVVEGKDGNKSFLSDSHSVNVRNKQHNLGRNGVVVDEGGVHATENTPEPIRKVLDGNSLDETKMTPVDDLSLSEDGVTRVASTGAEVSIKGAKTVEVKNEKGEKEIAYQFKVVDNEGNESYVDRNDIDFGSSSEGLFYESFADLGIDPAYFDSYVANFDKADFNVKEGDIPAEWQYAAGFNEAVNFGKAGLDGGYKMLSGDGKSTVSSTYLENGEFTRGLKENVRNLAYNLGKVASENRLEAEAKAIDKAVQKRKDSGKGKVKGKGRFHYEENSTDKLNKHQRAGLLAAKRLTELGNDVYIFRSTEDAYGNRIDDRGEISPNGFYRGDDGSIHIDLYAGEHGNGLMVYTIAHELLHNGRRYAQREFKIFKNLLYEWYGEQYDPKHHGSIDKLIRKRMKDEGVSWDDAEEEVLADFCEPFLTDGNIEERVAQLKAADEETFNFVQKIIQKFWNMVKSIYNRIAPDSTEGQFSREHKDSLERVYDAFAKMTYAASENLQWLGTISEAKTASEVLSAAGVSVDADTGSAVMNSVRYAPKTDAEIDKTAKALAESMGVSVKQAEKWVRSETSLASIILDPSNAMFLDYEADERYEAIKKNAEYPQGTVDFSNLCKKRREFTVLYDKLQKEFPNRVFTAEDLEKIRQILIDEKIEVACGLCYVEERRQLLGEIAQGFIDGYKNGTLKEKVSAALDANDTYVPTIYDLITYDGYRALTSEHPSIAEAFKIHNNARGMQAGRLIEGLAEYKREILGWSQKKVDFVNSVGGLRVFSFSDFEATHLLDLVQVIQDCAAKGVMVQAYTKVPAFANAVKDTNVKVNRSLIANGTGIKIVDGRQVLDLDPVEGININDKDFFDSTDSKSVGNILVGMADDQIRLAMKSGFVDYIIPFHTGLKKDILHAKKIDHWTNYKNFQTDKDLASGKVAKTQINVYVDVIQAAESEGKPIKTKVDFVNKFLAVAKERGIKPRFWNFLDVDSNGDYVYTEGYHKFLVDFKLFDKNGNILPQMPVVPEFDDALNARILNEYVEGKKSPVSRDKVYDRLVKEVVEDGVKKSTRRDSKGRKLSEGQQEFFKDSKVTDADGNLLVVYHGTPRKFTTFRQGVAQGWGRGIYFTDNRENASEYGENIVEAYLNITNPYYADTMDYDKIGAEKTKAYRDYDMEVWKKRFDEYDTYEEYKADGLGVDMYEIYTEEVEVFNKILRELGYDGIIADHSNNIEGLEIVAFYENQPKLTTNSDPTDSDDIRYSTRKKAPTFYSKMEQIIGEIKPLKMGAGGVVPYLKGKGVKNEEIKWSGIEAFLEGKKSVSKEELQEFAAGSQLQIDEVILDNKDRPYTEDQQKRLDAYESERDKVAKRLADEWKKITNTEFPVRNAGAGLESAVANAIIDTNLEQRNATFEGRLLKKLRNDLVEVIKNNDDFGFDSWKDALRSIHRHRRDFIGHYEMSTNDKAVIVKYCNALNAYNEVPSTITYDDADRLRAIARETDPWNQKIMEVKHEHNEEEAKHMTNWGQYRLDGGKNYKEMLFVIPNSTYSNDAMYTHWKERNGVLAHARVQDFDVNGQKMLFVEEIQSDWHNAGQKDGYFDSKKQNALRKKANELNGKYREERKQLVGILEEHYGESASDSFIYSVTTEDLTEASYLVDILKFDGVLTNVIDRLKALSNLGKEKDLAQKEQEKHSAEGGIPDAPFRDNYHEYALKRLIRMAAEEGYDSIGWTPAAVQMERWNPKRKTNAEMGIRDAKNPDAVAFEEGYNIEYDQDIPKFLRKYGKKWEATVGSTTLDNGTEVWSMDIPDSMKESVLYEGQAKFSKRKRNSEAVRGVYINDSTQAFTEQILSGEKTIETREQPKNRKYPELHKFIGERIGIVRSGKGKTTLVGFATVVDEIVYNTEAEFRADDDKHLVKKGSAYDFKSKKYGYVLADVEGVTPWEIPKGAKRNGMSDVDIAAYHTEQKNPYASRGKNFYKDKTIYSYDFLVSQDPMVVLDVPNLSDIYTDGKIDKNRIISVGKKNALAQDGSKSGVNDVVYVQNRYTGSTIEINNQSIKHGIGGKKNFAITNARLGMIIGDVIRNGIPINEITPSDGAVGTYALVSYAVSSAKKEFLVIAHIDVRGNKLVGFESVDSVHSIRGRIKKGSTTAVNSAQGLSEDSESFSTSVISISDLLKFVNLTSQSILSDDVLEHFGEARKEDGYYYGEVRHQTRKSGTSARSLLANALESVAQNDIEKNKLAQYKEKIDLLNEEEKKLQELNEQIHKLSFPEKGTKRDQKKINDLRFEANITLNRINTLDKSLFDLEASAPLKKVLQREKDAVRKKYEREGKEQTKQKVKAKEESISKKIAKRDLEKLVLDTARWLTNPKKDEVKCPDILRVPFAEFLNSIDMSSRKMLRGGGATKNDLRIIAAMDSLSLVVKRIQKAQDPSNQESVPEFTAGYLDLPANFMENIDLMSQSIKRLMVMSDTGYDILQEMSSEEMKTLIHVIKTLKKSIRDMQRLYTNYRFANAVTLGQNTMEFVDQLGADNGKIPGLKDFYVWQNTVPYYAFKRFGKAGESVFESFMDAQDKQAFLDDEIHKFAENTWTTKEVKEWSNDVHDVLLPSGATITLTTADAMNLYCLARRQHAGGHLVGYGVRVKGIKKGGKKLSDSIAVFTEADVDEILKTKGKVLKLTDRQVEVAEAMQRFMSKDCAEWGNEISMKRFLTKMFNEEYYVPIQSDPLGMDTKDPEAPKSDLFRLLNISATKPLTEGANNRIIVRNLFDVFTEHANDMARLNAWGMALLDYMKWMNYREKTVDPTGKNAQIGVRQSIETAYSESATSYLLNLVKDINGIGDGGRGIGWVEKMFSHGKTAAVGANLRVVALQFTAYPRAALVLSHKSLLKGAAKLKPSIAKAKKYCGIALWKSFGYYDTDVSRSMEAQIKGDVSVLDRVKDASMWLAGKADEVTWGYLWNACEAEIAKTGEYEVGSEEFNIAVGKKLREVIYSSQVVDSVLTRSQLMRSKNSFAKMSSSFMSEPTMTHNITLDCMMQYNIAKRQTGSKKAALAKTWKHTARATSTVMLTTLAVALVGGFANAIRNDDDEPFDKKLYGEILDAFLEELIPFSRLPVASDITSLLAAKLGVGFFNSSNMTTDYLATISNAYDAWVDIIKNGDDAQKTVYYALYNTVKSLSQFTGVPGSNAMREVVSMWNSTVGDADYNMKIRTWEPSDYADAENLYQAIESGDSKWQRKMEAKWADETERQKYLKMVIGDHYTAGDIDYDTAEDYLREHCGMEDEDVYWQMDKWQHEAEKGSSDGYSKYDDFFTAVESGKNLKSVIKNYTDNGVDKKTLASQITSHFKPLYKEMSKSERANIKGYLLNAYAILGYDRSKKSKDIDKWLED